MGNGNDEALETKERCMGQLLPGEAQVCQRWDAKQDLLHEDNRHQYLCAPKLSGCVETCQMRLTKLDLQNKKALNG